MQNKPGSRFSSLSRRRQWLLIIIIVALAAALLAGLYMLAQHFERAALVAEEPRAIWKGALKRRCAWSTAARLTNRSSGSPPSS